MNRFVVSPVLLSLIALGLHACVPEAPTRVDGNRRPAAAISSPANGTEFGIGDAVAFQGTATDEEDGTLPAPMLLWHSSLDGTLGIGPALSRTDLSVGTHEIRLIATDSDGFADTARVVIGVGETPNLSPVGSFSYGCTGLSCAFTDGSSDPDGAVVAWAWDFGDGGASSDRNPEHAFASGGTYDVVLTVTDDAGATGDVARQVTVTDPNQGPVASFSWTCADLVCQFTEASSDSDGTIVAWLWEFGDGGTSTERNPSHEFVDAGTWPVTLTVTDDDGAGGSSTQDVAVTGVRNRAPTATILQPADNEKFDDKERVQFRGEASDPDGDALDLRWLSDRDGQFGSGTDVNTRDLSEGQHRISFIADDGALADTARIRIEIED